MIYIVYISGKYRHWKADGTLNEYKMRQEELYEEFWSALVVECGHFPIPPIKITSSIADVLAEDDWIERDLDLIDILPPSRTLMLMRPEWDAEPASYGAIRENERATDREIKIIHAKVGAEEVRKYLTGLLEE